jgi:hypothetical protein
MHRDISYEVSAHRFNDKPGLYDFKVSWATYVILTEEMHEKFKVRINDAPWNGGQTYYRKVTEEHVGVSPELAAQWNKPYYKIGDDFTHLWDMERGGWGERDRPHFEHHIKRVIDYLHDGPTEDSP